MQSTMVMSIPRKTHWPEYSLWAEERIVPLRPVIIDLCTVDHFIPISRVVTDPTSFDLY